MFPNCVGKSDQLRQNLLYPLLYSLFKIALSGTSCLFLHLRVKDITDIVTQKVESENCNKDKQT